MEFISHEEVITASDVADNFKGLNLGQMATIYDWFFEIPTQMVVMEALNDAIEDGKITSEIRDIVMEYVRETQESCLDELETFNSKEWQDRWQENINEQFGEEKDEKNN